MVMAKVEACQPSGSQRFVDETNVDLLAVGIGNAQFTSTDSIDITESVSSTKSKLVLHGVQELN